MATDKSDNRICQVSRKLPGERRPIERGPFSLICCYQLLFSFCSFCWKTWSWSLHSLLTSGLVPTFSTRTSSSFRRGWAPDCGALHYPFHMSILTHACAHLTSGWLLLVQGVISHPQSVAGFPRDAWILLVLCSGSQWCSLSSNTFF